jgi:hypothetical protein
MLLTETLIYLAGYFDGEGSVCMQISNKNYRCPSLKICVFSGDKEVVELFGATFGGNVHQVKPRGNDKRQVYSWTACGSKAQAILKQLLPFLIAKKKPAEMVMGLSFITVRNGKRPHTLDSVEVVIRTQVAKQLSAYNNRVTIN